MENKKQEVKVPLLKNYTEISCPHCKKSIIISQLYVNPVVSNVYTAEGLDTNKQEIKKLLKDTKFKNEDEKKELLKVLNNENSIFDAEDVKNIKVMIEKQEEK